MVASPDRSQQRPRFSLLHLFLLVAVVAILLWAWKQWVYVHPAHSTLSYEQAPYAASSIRVGSNRITIGRVARPRRDGNLRITSAAGQAALAASPHDPQLRDAAAWLDTAQLDFDIGPGEVDILEVRVFDHEKRESLAKVHAQTGFRMVDSDTLQIYRLGADLPPAVDIWFRLQSYPADTPTAKLMPELGAACTFEGNRFSVREIVSGFSQYSSQTGLVGSPDDYEFSLVLDFDGQGADQRYQVTAVATDGRRIPHPGAPHFIAGTNRMDVLKFPLALDQLEYLEVRRFGGRHKFFFDGVALPSTTGGTYAPAPQVNWTVDPGQQFQQFHEFAPLVVLANARRGAWISGTLGNDGGVYFTAQQAGPTDTESTSTIAYRVHGLTEIDFQLTAASEDAEDRVSLPSAGRSGSSWNQSSQIGYTTVAQPIVQIRELRIEITPN